MSATLLKAMQMPLKCDKKQVLSLTNRLSASIVTQIVCVLLFKRVCFPQLGQIDAFVTEQGCILSKSHHT